MPGAYDHGGGGGGGSSPGGAVAVAVVCTILIRYDDGQDDRYHRYYGENTEKRALGIDFAA